MRIVMTGFALRQWDEAAGRKQIVGMSPVELVDQCNRAVAGGAELAPGYAPFCTHLFLQNTTPIVCSFVPITDENRTQLKSGYVARRERELAVLERWFEDVEPVRAAYLDVILYSKAQIDIEAADGPDDDVPPDCDWGIVSLIGTLEAVEPPMPPITQLRNALGVEEGGSGVPIDREAYARAVEFWEAHAPIR